MTERNTADTAKIDETRDKDFFEFVPDPKGPVSSTELLVTPESNLHGEKALKPAVSTALESEDIEVSLAFRELAVPKLPKLGKENRAVLLMQSPNRLFFYWSVGANPYQTLNRALGNETSSYTLVAKLVNIKLETEEIHAVEAENSWWFDVDSNSEYRAEVGFYAPNRPFVRVMYSNDISTPRKSPSPRPDSASDWTVTAEKFALVLDVSGFSQDAFDVALAGDDWVAADTATQSAFSSFIGKPDLGPPPGISSEEIRYAMFSLASGVPLEYLRHRIGPSLFAVLSDNVGRITSATAFAELQQQFGLEGEGYFEEEMGASVFGTSLINFPRVLRQNRTLPKYSPHSSFSIGAEA